MKEVGQGGSISEALLDLFLQKQRGKSTSRELNFSKMNVDAFFIILKGAFKKLNFLASGLYYVNETGLYTVQSNLLYIIELKGKRQFAALASAKRGATVTIIICMNAFVHCVPQVAIFSRKNIPQTLTRDGCPQGTVSRAHLFRCVKGKDFTKSFTIS